VKFGEPKEETLRCLFTQLRRPKVYRILLGVIFVIHIHYCEWNQNLFDLGSSEIDYGVTVKFREPKEGTL